MYPLCITLFLFTQFSPLVLSPYPLLLPLDMLVSIALSAAVFEFRAHYYYLFSLSMDASDEGREEYSCNEKGKGYLGRSALIMYKPGFRLIYRRGAY